MEYQKKSYTTKISPEQAEKLVEETTKKELEALNKLIQLNPDLLIRRKSLEIIDDELDLDIENNSGLTISSSSSDSDSSNSKSKSKHKSKSKSKSKSTKTKSDLKNLIKDSDLISKKDISIDKLESENRYLKLDLSNSNIKNIELASKNSKSEKKLTDVEKSIEFYFKSIKFLETNYMEKIESNEKLLNKNNTKINIENITQTENQVLSQNKFTFRAIYKNKLLMDVITRLDTMINNMSNKINFLGLNEMKNILEKCYKTKSQVQEDYELVKKLSNIHASSNVNEEFVSNQNLITIYFIRRIGAKKENIIEKINKLISYYEYMYKIEDMAYKLLISILFINIGYIIIKNGYGIFARHLF